LWYPGGWPDVAVVDISRSGNPEACHAQFVRELRDCLFVGEIELVVEVHAHLVSHVEVVAVAEILKVALLECRLAEGVVAGDDEYGALASLLESARLFLSRNGAIGPLPSR
jgi:hypothetical protein